MKKQAFNPYLPSWEYIPDGEPYSLTDVFTSTVHTISSAATPIVSATTSAGRLPRTISETGAARALFTRKHRTQPIRTAACAFTLPM